MRPLEWLFLLALLITLLLPYLSRARHQPRRLTIAALAPASFGVLHLVAEGWRTQMIPLYALAVWVLLLRCLQRRRTTPHRPGVLASCLTALAFLSAGLLPGWALPIVSLPNPTGPYHIGVVDRELSDGARRRRLMVSVWYPAAQSGDLAPLFQHPQAVTTGLASAFGVPAAALLLQHLRYSTVAASIAAPALAEHAPFPVLVFSHGLVGLRAQNSSTFQELASWGYVVVAVDHTDAAAVTVFPDGEVRPFDLQRVGIGPADLGRSTEILLPVWVADQRFVYDTVEQWANNDPLLAGKLDVRRIGSFGHSFGGVTALAVCRVEARCVAAANLDGGFANDSLSGPAIRPLLLMTSSGSNQIPKAIAGWARLISSASAPAYWLELPNSNHYSFTIAPLISPLLAPPGFDGRAGLRTVDKYLRAFFDRYLRGQKTRLLEPTSGETDVRWRTR